MTWREEIIGDCRLILGDCREIMPTIGNVDAVVTDPPYGIGLEKKSNDFRGSRWFDDGNSKKASVLYEDDVDHVKLLISEVIPVSISVSNRSVIFCGPAMMWNYPVPDSIGSVFTPNGSGRCSWGFQCTHPVLFYGKDPFLQDGKGGRPNSFRHEQPNLEKIDHPCPKPIAWMLWAIERSTRIGETVLDPFMGSGTTGVACVNLGRKFIGIEIEPKYFDIACRRIEKAYQQPRLFQDKPIKHKQEAML